MSNTLNAYQATRIPSAVNNEREAALDPKLVTNKNAAIDAAFYGIVNDYWISNNSTSKISTLAGGIGPEPLLP